MDEAKRTKCLVVGAGPVGALAALYAARRGWQVEVYDLRGDLRDESITPLNFTRSINLALSERGINSMRQSGSNDLLDVVLSETVPMHGRMIHSQDSAGNPTEKSQLYDVHGRFLRAIDRAALNKTLLAELEKFPNVKLLFHHKLTGADFRKREAWFEHRLPSDGDARPQEIQVDFDIILGCDGAHSAVRYHMMKFVRMTYEQTYIDTLWCEFTIPPATTQDDFISTPLRTNNFKASPNHLHIWPSKNDMFIAIPSCDKTFTCTLFAPAATFSRLEKYPETIEKFFNDHFPGAASLIGPDKLRQQFEQNPHLPLISVKCSPHHFSSSGVILGDAAHAMVPFYGQGMNAGLEDVRVLFQHFDAHLPTAHGRSAALDAYNAERVADAHTINDLALYNYWEMHQGVQSPTYLLRKKVEEFLSDKMPWTGFATQYSRVSFSNQRYSEVAMAVARQRRALIRGMVSFALLPLLSVAFWKIVMQRRAGRSSTAGLLSFSGLGGVLERLSEVAKRPFT